MGATWDETKAIPESFPMCLQEALTCMFQSPCWPYITEPTEWLFLRHTGSLPKLMSYQGKGLI